MRLHLLRHALVEKPFQNSFNGWFDPDIEPIETNMQKTLQTKLQQLPIENIVSSDLKRCVKTLHQLNIYNFTLDKRLREFRFKEFIEGKKFEEFQERTTPKDLENIDNWIEFIKGEELEDFQKRVESFLKEVQENTLICTHKGTINMFVAIQKRERFQDLFSIPIENLDLLTLEF